MGDGAGPSDGGAAKTILIVGGLFVVAFLVVAGAAFFWLSSRASDRAIFTSTQVSVVDESGGAGPRDPVRELSADLEAKVGDEDRVTREFLAALCDGRIDDLIALGSDSWRAASPRDLLERQTRAVRLALGRPREARLVHSYFEFEGTPARKTKYDLVYIVEFEKSSGYLAATQTKDASDRWRLQHWKLESPAFTADVK